MLLAATVAVGVVCSRMLLWLGVDSMLWRYPLTLLVAYLAFFGFVRVWLWALGLARSSGLSEARSQLMENGGDIADGLFRGSRSGSSASSDFGFKGGAGQFGGGGASASFAEGALPATSTPTFSMPAGGGKGGSSLFDGFDLDVDDAWPLVLAIIELALVVGGVFAYVLYAGPAVLVDAAFEATLAGGLVRAGRNTARGDWMGSVLRATWIPFALVQVAAIAVAWMAAIYTPQAHTLGEILRQLLLHGQG